MDVPVKRILEKTIANNTTHNPNDPIPQKNYEEVCLPSRIVTKNDLEIQPMVQVIRLSWIPILLMRAASNPSLISLDYLKYIL